MAKNQIIVYCRSALHKKVLCEAAQKHLLCRSVSGYVAAWLGMIVKYLQRGVTIEQVGENFDESVKLFLGEEDENKDK